MAAQLTTTYRNPIQTMRKYPTYKKDGCPKKGRPQGRPKSQNRKLAVREIVRPGSFSATTFDRPTPSELRLT